MNMTQKNKLVKHCRVCNTELIPYINWTRGMQNNGNYICKFCQKEKDEKFAITDPEKYRFIRSRSYAKCRGLGFNQVYNNIISEPYVWHHINHDDVVSVPKDIHELYNGYGFRGNRHKFMISQVIGQIYNKYKS